MVLVWGHFLRRLVKHLRPTVHIVQSEIGLRHGLQRMLQRADIRATTYTTAEQFFAEYDPGTPGCLIADLCAVYDAKFRLDDCLTLRAAPLPVIMLSGENDVAAAINAFRQGAMDVVVKPVDPSQLLSRVRHAVQLDTERRQIEEQRARVNAKLARLTPRERQVLEMVVAGDSTRQIAARLGVSARTVDVHRARVMRKMQVDGVAKLVTDAAVAGVISIGDALDDRD